jgi:adenosine deaminase
MIDYKYFIKKMPKVELHFHLEGAIPINCIFELVKKYDKSKKFNSICDIEKRYNYKDFPQFIETWHWQSQFLKEYEDFTFIAENIAKHLIKQNIKYVEANFTPADFANQHGLVRERIAEAIRKGLDKHKNSVKVNLIYDFNRDLGAEFALKQLRETVYEIRDLGVLGIGLGGQEHLYPAELFKEVFLEARNSGLRTTLHAGEYAGPESIWSALKVCHAERIGHCTSAIKDKNLLEYLQINNIPVELCPISNVMTKVVNGIKKHPIKQYYEQGLNISINTDDPVLFNTSLCKEYTTLIDKVNFSLKDIRKILEATIKSSWCSEKEKKELLNELHDYYKENINNQSNFIT